MPSTTIAGRQIDELRTRLTGTVEAKTALAREAEDRKASLAHLDAEVTRAEAELSARGADDVGDGVGGSARLALSRG